MLATVLLIALVVLAGCGSGQGSQLESGDPCAVSGTVRTTVFDGASTFVDIPDSALRVEPELQFFEGDLRWNLIDVAGEGFWSISGSIRWTGELNLDTVTGLKSGVPHTARIFYELETGNFAGSVFVPVESANAGGTISATLRSEYGSGRFRTTYSFGFLPDYVQTSTEVAVQWRYFAVTNEISFEVVGSLDLGELEAWTLRSPGRLGEKRA